MVRKTVRVHMRSYSTETASRARVDKLAGEEPLEVRLNGAEFTVLMRTPGHDVELIHGLLLSEGLITVKDDIESIDFSYGLGASGTRDYNTALVRLNPAITIPEMSRRNVYTSSSCGICGTQARDAVEKISAYPPQPAYTEAQQLSITELLRLPTALRDNQPLFSTTGGVHAAGLFTFSDDRQDTARVETAPRVVREDVGRHNAVDKLLGWALLRGYLPLKRTVIQVSGRASYELVQKAYMGGASVLSAVSAPSYAACELAENSQITLVGFNRSTRCNVYAHHERLWEGS